MKPSLIEHCLTVVPTGCYTDGARKAANNILLGSRDFNKLIKYKSTCSRGAANWFARLPRATLRERVRNGKQVIYRFTGVDYYGR